MRPSEQRRRFGAVGSVLVMGIVGLSGCQGMWPLSGSSSLLDNTQFMNAWETYLHCRLSSEPDEIRADLRRLGFVAHAVTAEIRTASFLPIAIRAFVAKPPLRLAVDPHAMMVACALHGGEVAQFAGRPELALELFTVVLAAQAGGTSAYYPADAGRTFTYRD